MEEAEETLRAIGEGEVDAFVVSHGGAGRVFTLSTADRPYRMFVEGMRDGAATVSSTGVVLYANRRLAELLSLTRERIIGSPLTEIVAGDLPFDLTGVGELGRFDGIAEVDLVGGDGVTVPVLVGASRLEVDDGHLTCLTFTDLSVHKAQDREITMLIEAQTERVAELQDAQAALVEQATHDPLTGLPNRVLVVDRIDQALAQAARSGLCTAVLFVDLDHFKHVNDTHGHAVGDTVLCRVAEQIVAVVRPMDTVARIGGDEFVVLAHEVDSHLHAVDISTRIVAAVSRRPDGPEVVERVSASVGVAVSVGGRGQAELLLQEADTAMYHAKSLGGGRVELFDESIGRQVAQRSNARRMLQSALEDHRVTVHYQPIVDLGTGRVAGFEALARITQPDGSILQPAAFLPDAEESGQVVPLGAQVLRLACAEADAWHHAGPPLHPLTVAVNLSSRQFERGGFPAEVRAALDETGLDPRRLHLELTETAIMELEPYLLDQLRSIRDLGVQIGLDDFGTGYASLTHLRRLPVTFVKIDRSFVQGLGTDQEDDRIVVAVVDLAANLGLRSIAEGIETPQQLARLRQLGCDQAQGYLFARPMPPLELSGAVRLTRSHSGTHRGPAPSDQVVPPTRAPTPQTPTPRTP